MRDPGSIPRGGTYVNQDSPVSVVSLHWWPWHDWSLWPHLRRASSRTITSSSRRQYDNPTWSHTALLSQFHARCRSSFRLHNRHSWLLGGSPMESLQSHCIHTQLYWSSGPPVCFPSWGTRVQSPGGYSCENGIFLLALSRYGTPIWTWYGKQLSTQQPITSRVLKTRSRNRRAASDNTNSHPIKRIVNKSLQWAAQQLQQLKDTF
jgi:hypothetical protein